MKKTFFHLLILMVLVSLSGQVSAQKDIRKKDLKSLKLAEKEAKKRQKEGWYVPPGSIPMAKLFEQGWAYELELKEDGSNKYLMATGAATSGTKAAADQAALTAARNELAGALSARVSELIQTKRATDQIDQATANTLDKTVSNSKTLIQAELTNVKVAYKIYKDVEDKSSNRKNIMMETKIFYSQDEAMRTAQRVIRRELEDESDELGKQLDDILGIGKTREPEKREKPKTKEEPKKPIVEEPEDEISVVVEVEKNPKKSNEKPAGNCAQPMSATAFAKSRDLVNDVKFDESKLRVAKEFTQSNCLTMAQIKEITKLLAFENNKLEYLKYAHAFCYDTKDYYQLGNILNFSNNKEDLNDFLKDRER
jgi:hypothetical protein